MSGINQIRTAATDLQDALAAYDPDSMRQMVQDLPVIGDALSTTAIGVRAIAVQAGQWPTAAAVTDALYEMAADLNSAAQTAGVANAFTAGHGADIERTDAPRGGSRAAESRWDVSYQAASDPGQRDAPATRPREASMATPARAAGSGHYNPDQPRATDGKWTKVGDVLGYADDDTCYGTDRVTGAGPVPTELALIQYPDDPAFVSVATPKDRYNPVTGQDGTGYLYCAPLLDPTEAEIVASRLDELATMVESGYQVPQPTAHTRARQRLELLLQDDRASTGDRIIVGDDGDDFPLTTGQLLKLLKEADPTLSAPQTRHAVRARASASGGGEDGTVWLDIATGAAGAAHIVVAAVEGIADPNDDYWKPYTAQHTPASARELATKLRAFAHAARRRTQP